MNKLSKLSIPLVALGIATGAACASVQAETVTVKSGDTFWGISQEYGVSVEKLKNLNSNIKPKAIPIGAEIQISEESNQDSSREVYHTVAPHDTLYGLAQLHEGVTVQDLLDWNPGVDPYNLQIGSQIRVQPLDNSESGLYHTVAPYNTLYDLAQLHEGVTVQDLLDWNPGIDPYNLQIGSEIRVSG